MFIACCHRTSAENGRVNRHPGVAIDESRIGRWARSACLLLALSAIGIVCSAGRALAVPAHEAPAFTLRVGYQPYYAEAWAGVLVRSLRLYAGRLPATDNVAFTVGTRGAGVLVSALRRGDIDLAYLGIEPTLTVTQDLARGDFRIIAVSAVSRRLCNVILAQPGAPPLNSPAAIRWLSGKRIAVPRGSCADLFLADVLARGHVRPANIFNQSIDMLSASLRSHAVDAVAVWEPNATELVRTTGAKRLLDGNAIDESSAAFIVVRASLLRDHPDVVAGWLAAERAAELLLARGGSAAVPLDRLESRAAELPQNVVHTAWWGDPAADPGSAPPATFPFVVTPAVSTMLESASVRMADRGLLAKPGLRAHSVADETARRMLAGAINPIVTNGTARR